MHSFSRAHGRPVPIGVSSPSPRYFLRRVLAIGIALSFTLGAALVTTVISAAPASAHPNLIMITPASNAQLTRAPTQVVVEFDESVAAAFVTVLVTNAAGISVAKGKPTVLGFKVTQALSPDMVAGDYRIVHRVVGADGHPIAGESKFTLTLTAPRSPETSAEIPPSSTRTSAPSGPAAATPSAEGSTAGQSGWLTRFLLPIAGTLGLLIVGAGVILWKNQRR